MNKVIGSVISGRNRVIFHLATTQGYSSTEQLVMNKLITGEIGAKNPSKWQAFEEIFQQFYQDSSLQYLEVIERVSDEEIQALPEDRQ